MSVFHDIEEARLDLVLPLGRGGKARRGVLAPRVSGMQAEGSRQPVGAVEVEIFIGTVFDRPRHDRPERTAPDRKIGGLRRIDGELIETAAIEDHHPIGVGLAHKRQKRGGVEHQLRVGGLVEEPPDRHAGVIAVTLDHPEHLIGIAPDPFGASLVAPAGQALVVDHKADPVAQIELEPAGHPGDIADHIKAHRLAGEDIAAVQVGIQRQAVGDRRVAPGVGTFEVNPLSIEPEGAALEPEVAETAHGRPQIGPDLAQRRLRGVAAIAAGGDKLQGAELSDDGIEVRVVQFPEL